MNKYYINETVWPVTNAISANILEVAPDGHKRLIVTDDMKTIQTYRQKAERVTAAEIDALWG